MITLQQHIIPNCHCTASCGNPQGTNATSETYRRAGARGAESYGESKMNSCLMDCHGDKSPRNDGGAVNKIKKG